MGYETWTRTKKWENPNFRFTWGSTLAPLESSGSVNVLVDKEVTTSDRSPTWRIRNRFLENPEKLHRNTLAAFRNADYGHNFVTEKWSTVTSHPRVTGTGLAWGSKLSTIDAPLFATANLATRSSDPFGASAELALMLGAGQKAIAATLPNKPDAGLANLVGELRRDGLPRPVLATLADSKSWSDLLRNSGGEYLNIEFGWKPLVSDLTKLFISVRDSRRIIDEYSKLPDRQFHRRYEFPDSITTEQVPVLSTDKYPYPPGPTTPWVQPSGVKTRFRTSRSEMWFSGRYRMAVPDLSDLGNDLAKWEREANKLLGTRLTPEVLWNLTPWTWLSDWFLQIGDFVTNVSYLGSDGLVLQYGYIMRHIHVTDLWSLRGVKFGKTNVPLDLIETKLVYDKKRRVKATPYGFYANPDTFTAKQWAILSALGLAQGVRKSAF